MTSMNGQERKFLIFTLQGSLFALDLTQVAEVADSPQMSPIPLAPAYYAGAISFHGDIVAVMNLAQFLGLDECRQPEKIVVLRQETASLAFLVDTIQRIVSGNGLYSCESQDTGFSSGMLTLPEGAAVHLNLEKLIFSAEVDMQSINNK